MWHNARGVGIYFRSFTNGGICAVQGAIKYKSCNPPAPLSAPHPQFNFIEFHSVTHGLCRKPLIIGSFEIRPDVSGDGSTGRMRSVNEGLRITAECALRDVGVGIAPEWCVCILGSAVTLRGPWAAGHSRYWCYCCQEVL